MFSTKERLAKKTGKYGVGRFSYLEQLIAEYKTTKSQDAKEQVLANLANFAYDPINYEYLWRLKVLDVFFGALDEDNKKLVSFGLGGICNICLDPLSRQYIIRINGIQRISSFLSSNEESCVLSAITTLIYLDTPNTRAYIVIPEIVERMKELSKSTNRRIVNLARIFLEDLCKIKTEEPNISTVKDNSDKKLTESTNTTKYNKLKRIKTSTVTSATTSDESNAYAGTSASTSDANIDKIIITHNTETACTSTSGSEISDASKCIETFIEPIASPSTSTGNC